MSGTEKQSVMEREQTDSMQADSPQNQPDSGRSFARPSSKLLHGSITFLAFIVVFVIYSIWLGGKFDNTASRALDIHQNTPVFMLALAALITLIAGQFDLSIASLATLSCFLVVGLPTKEGWPFAVVLIACMLVGVLAGAVNGFLVVRLKINTFIATLGTGGVFLGLSAVYSKGANIVGTENLPSWFSGPNSLGALGSTFPAVLLWIAAAAAALAMFVSLRRSRPQQVDQRRWDIAAVACVALLIIVLFVLGLPHWIDSVSWMIAVLIAVAAFMWLLLDFTTFGRYLKATGSNADASRLAGINPDKETFKAFVIGGLLAAIAGILLGAGQGTATPGNAVPFLLPAFTAVFLSTVILSTGRFHVWGTLVGGIFLVWVGQGLIVGGLAFTWTEVINGAVLIAAVSLSSIFRRQTS